MKPAFNTAGPCFPGEHYMIPPERRLSAMLDLIASDKYFVMHAGRQVGKTTSAIWLRGYLRTIGKRSLWVDLQTARDEPSLERAFPTIFSSIEAALRRSAGGLQPASSEQTRAWLRDPPSALREYLGFLTSQDPRPLVVFFDEADCLVGRTMVSFLTQLRDGYIARQESPFPSSIGLIGMRTVRDFVLLQENQVALAWLGTSSPFNITSEAVGLGAFTEAEVAELLNQHTTHTGQRFEPEAISRVWALGLGHPWLTNALADEAVRKQAPDRSTPVTAAHIDAAKETLIENRRSHIDSLASRLREPRIKNIIAPMLVGDRTRAGDVLSDDFAYAVGMGLLRRNNGHYEIANPIYQEVIVRVMTYDEQAQIWEKTSTYVTADGGLDLMKLMRAWQKFWRQDGHLAAEGFDYKEAGPHLVLMAFLQRIVNGGGKILREYALGRGALDLLILWREHRYALEVKLRRDSHTEADALEQVARYLDRAGLTEGWLVMFDLRKELSWADKLTIRDAAYEGKTVHIVGC